MYSYRGGNGLGALQSNSLVEDSHSHMHPAMTSWGVDQGQADASVIALVSPELLPTLASSLEYRIKGMHHHIWPEAHLWSGVIAQLT